MRKNEKIHELEDLFGHDFSEALKQSEAIRYIRECLLINPYITDIEQASADFSDENLRIGCTVKTVYGEVNIVV